MPYAAKTPCRGGCCGRLATSLYLQAHPIAIDYFETHNGVVYLAEVVDHIIPHRGDMKLFWDPNNWQGLHEGGSRLQDSARRRRILILFALDAIGVIAGFCLPGGDSGTEWHFHAAAPGDQFPITG